VAYYPKRNILSDCLKWPSHRWRRFWSRSIYATFGPLWPWPWPWIRSYDLPSCSTHRRLPTEQISFKWEKLFVHERTLQSGLLGRLDLTKNTPDSTRASWWSPSVNILASVSSGIRALWPNRRRSVGSYHCCERCLPLTYEAVVLCSFCWYETS